MCRRNRYTRLRSYPFRPGRDSRTGTLRSPWGSGSPGQWQGTVLPSADTRRSLTQTGGGIQPTKTLSKHWVNFCKTERSSNVNVDTKNLRQDHSVGTQFGLLWFEVVETREYMHLRTNVTYSGLVGITHGTGRTPGPHGKEHLSVLFGQWIGTRDSPPDSRLGKDTV